MCSNKTICFVFSFLVLSFSIGHTRSNIDSKLFLNQKSASPAYCVVEHRIGKLGLAINNNGTIGTGFASSPLYDFFTGAPVHSSDFPQNSTSSYLFGGSLWVGAVVGEDTLVSVGADGWNMGFELHPDNPPGGFIQYRSTLSDDPSIYTGAISHEDYIAVYYDTLTAGVPNDWSGRPHIPLNIEVIQTSYAWSYPYTEDFILIEYKVKNIGSEPLHDVYFGILMDNDVGYLFNSSRHTDDLTGFLAEYPMTYHGCQYTDNVNIAYIADNDGDPSGGSYNNLSSTGVTGMKLIRSPLVNEHLAYNWYISNANPSLDFGPREKSGVGAWPEPFRDFGTGGIGTPSGDANKYYMLRNQEIDYNQIYTASITPDDPLWMYPQNQTQAQSVSRGADTRYLLSFGSGVINPGETFPFFIAYVGGEYFHINPNAVNNLPDDPAGYYSQLNFADLVMNTKWAEWVFDNPGVDTDGDGYFGQYMICGNDTFYTTGDGVPDLRPAAPPESPDVRYEPNGDQLTIRWNGLHSETTPDFLSHQIDFEGYNVYFQNGTSAAYEKYASYDIEDYYKYTFTYGSWVLMDAPFTLEELRCLYGSGCDDETFNPLDYTESTPYVHPIFYDSLFYFTPVAENNSQLGVTTPIIKTYPDQPYPSSLNPYLADPSELTEDGYLKYFEYELTVNLNQQYELPSMCYRASVTAFDYGSYIADVPPLESKKDVNEFYKCVELKARVSPNKLWAMMAHQLEPITGTITIGFKEENGMVGKAIDYESFGFNIPFDSVRFIDTCDGFTEHAKVMYYSVQDYLQSIIPFYDTTVIGNPLSGSYMDGQSVTTDGSLTLIGHISGDLNADGQIDISDLVFFAAYMFNDGPAPTDPESADMNHDTVVDIGDLIRLVELMF